MKNGYTFARFEKTLFVRVYGLANLKNAPVLSAFLSNEINDGVVGVYIDLSECRGMDSTFMGTLVGTSNKLEISDGGLVIANPTDHSFRLLEMLGVSTVIPVRNDVCVPETDFVPLDCDADLSKNQRMEVIRRAHVDLIKLSKENESKFRPIIDAFEKEMAEKKADNEMLSAEEEQNGEDETGFFV